MKFYSSKSNFSQMQHDTQLDDEVPMASRFTIDTVDNTMQDTLANSWCCS
jgi:hypothetical protein